MGGARSLSLLDVQAIRYCYTGKRGQLTLFADIYGVSTSTIFDIVNHITWPEKRDDPVEGRGG